MRLGRTSNCEIDGRKEKLIVLFRTYAQVKHPQSPSNISNLVVQQIIVKLLRLRLDRKSLDVLIPIYPKGLPILRLHLSWNSKRSCYNRISQKRLILSVIVLLAKHEFIAVTAKWQQLRTRPPMSQRTTPIPICGIISGVVYGVIGFQKRHSGGAKSNPLLSMTLISGFLLNLLRRTKLRRNDPQTCSRKRRHETIPKEAPLFDSWNGKIQGS